MIFDDIIIDEASKASLNNKVDGMVFNLVPGETINGMKIISSRMDVRKKFGAPIKSGSKRKSNGEIKYYDLFNGVVVLYNHRLYSELFRIYAGEVRVRNAKIFPGTIRDFVKIFPDAYQTPDAWLSVGGSVAAFETNGTINELYVSYTDYYDQY